MFDRRVSGLSACGAPLANSCRYVCHAGRCTIAGVVCHRLTCSVHSGRLHAGEDLLSLITAITAAARLCSELSARGVPLRQLRAGPRRRLRRDRHRPVHTRMIQAMHDRPWNALRILPFWLVCSSPSGFPLPPGLCFSKLSIVMMFCRATVLGTWTCAPAPRLSSSTVMRTRPSKRAGAWVSACCWVSARGAAPYMPSDIHCDWVYSAALTLHITALRPPGKARWMGIHS